MTTQALQHHGDIRIGIISVLVQLSVPLRCIEVEIPRPFVAYLLVSLAVRT